MYNKLSTLLVLVLAAGSLGGCAKKAKDLGPPAGGSSVVETKMVFNAFWNIRADPRS